MSMEADLVALLKTICTRTFPDVVTGRYSRTVHHLAGIGGESLRYVEGSAADRRNTLYADQRLSATRLEALTLIRQIEGCALRDRCIYRQAAV